MLGRSNKSAGHGLQSLTTEVELVRASCPKSGMPVVFVDTPGFDDIYSPVMTLSYIFGLLTEMYAIPQLSPFAY